MARRYGRDDMAVIAFSIPVPEPVAFTTVPILAGDHAGPPRSRLDVLDAPQYE
jgi:hypothetical protein